MNPGAATDPFRIPIPATGPVLRRVARWGAALAERVLGLRALNAIHAHLRKRGVSERYAERAVRSLGVRVSASDEDLARIPLRGPLVVVCNHPFGGLDGLILLSVLARIRPDLRVIANFLLSRIPQLHERFFFVNPFGGRAAGACNRAGMRAALEWVDAGGALGVFPAGEVSHLDLRNRQVSDPPWSHTVSRIVRRTGAAVVPMYFEGRNSALFQLAGVLNPRLRTLLLPRELLSKRGRRVTLRIGRAIPPQRMSRLETIEELTDFLRVRTYLLGGCVERADEASRRRKRASRRLPPVAGATPEAAVRSEFSALPADRRLADAGHLSVWWAGASEIPALLREIGRLREETFRVAGEGSGRELDLDRFDAWYAHLFLWDEQRGRLAGAYRVGATDEILPRYGVEGLYTHTLFRFDERLMRELGPAMEMGRSFVATEYQREYAPLMLLWKGIGALAVRSPHRRVLFGPVSISDDYRSTTRQFLFEFLRRHGMHAELAPLVAARRPPRFSPMRDGVDRRLGVAVSSVHEAEELVSELESGRRGMPILLRQYLRLNARLLGFNVDPEFGDVLDGLVVVDLLGMDERILDRYLGHDGARSFRAFHGGAAVPPGSIG